MTVIGFRFSDTDWAKIPAFRQNKAAADKLGLDAGWIYRALAERGNYGEIYQRGLGDKSILKLKRTANKLAKDGGLIRAPDFEK